MDSNLIQVKRTLNQLTERNQTACNMQYKLYDNLMSIYQIANKFKMNFGNNILVFLLVKV